MQAKKNIESSEYKSKKNIPIRKHLSIRHRLQRFRVSTLISQWPLPRHLSLVLK